MRTTLMTLMLLLNTIVVVVAMQGRPIIVISEKNVKRDTYREIYNTSSPEDLSSDYSKKLNKEVRYNNLIFVQSVRIEMLSRPREKRAFEPLDEIILGIQWVILNDEGIVIAEDNDISISHTSSLPIEIGLPEHYKAGKKITDALDANLIIKITTKDNQTFDFPFIVKNYTAHLLADFKYAQKNPNFGDVIGSIFTESILRSQVSLAYLQVKDLNKDSYPVIFNVPLVSFDNRNILLRNIELGFSVPVTVLNDNKILGYGGNIGLLKTSSKKTVLQFGYGTIKNSNTEAERKRYLYVGLDVQTVVDFLREVTTD
jgi:hypothetical protein